MRADETQTLYFYNDPWQTVVLQKYISGSTKPLAGVTFLLTDGSGAPIGGGSGEFVTDANGRITLSAPVGTTIVAREVRTVKGYVLDTTPQTITVKAGSSAQTVTTASAVATGNAATVSGTTGATVVNSSTGGNQMTFYDEATGSLTIIKRDSVTKQVLKGARYLITYANGEYVANNGGETSSNGVYTTDSLGQIVIKYLQPSTVVVREVEAPDGYVLDDTPITVEIAANDAQTIETFNAPIGGLELIKVSAADKAKRLEGVKFEIRKQDGGLVETVTTGKNGRVYVNLDAGSYYAVEVEGVKGFKVNAAPLYFEVKDGRTTTLTAQNIPYSGIEIHKIDSTTGAGIYNAKFLLYDAEKHPIGEYVSDQNGYVYIDDLTRDGRYFLRELECEGYNVDTQMKTVTVTAGEVIQIEWKNDPITGQIQVYKYAAEYNAVTGTAAGAPLSGAVFEIVDVRSGKAVDYITSDARGVAASKPLPLKRYQVKEVTAPAYWQVDGAVYDVTLEYPGQIIKLSAYDKPAELGTSITKRGNASVMAGQQMKYTITVANTSNVALENFFWHDRIPTDVATGTVLTTGTYSARLNYRVLYKTNYNGNYQVLASNLLTSNNYSFALNAITTQAGEVVTDIYFDFGKVPVGFQSVTAPTLSVQVSGTAANGYTMVNRADVGGKYGGTWQTANAGWATAIIRLGKTPTLPKTGY